MLNLQPESRRAVAVAGALVEVRNRSGDAALARGDDDRRCVHSTNSGGASRLRHPELGSTCDGDVARRVRNGLSVDAWSHLRTLRINGHLAASCPPAATCRLPPGPRS
jgi:hypothetical protein